MNRFFLIWMACAILPQAVNAQSTNEVQWAWSYTYGNGTDYSIANHLAVDNMNNLYVAGLYRGTLTVQSETLLGNPTLDQVFVSKFDSMGTLIWIRGLDWGNYVNAIKVDADNDLRLLCNSGVMVIYNGVDGTPSTYYDIPNSITDPNSPTPFDFVIDFELDTDDNMYILSRTDDDQTWISSTKVSAYATPNNTIVSTLWENTFESGFVAGGGSPCGISLDTNRNVYVSGTTELYDLNLSGTSIVSVPGVSNLFAVKYNSQGDAVWLSSDTMNYVQVLGTELNTIDNSLYLTGFTITEEVFYGDTLSVDTTNQEQIFLMKYDLDGNYDWVKSFPLATKSLSAYSGWGAMGNDLYVTDAGYVYLKGSFTGSIIFFNDTLVEDTMSVVLNTSADDVFVAKLDANGNPIWGKYAGNTGGLGLESGDFWVDPVADILYLVGYWAAPNNLLKSSGPVNSVKNIFMGKEGVPSVIAVDEIAFEGMSLLVYPNPSSGKYIISKAAHSKNINYQILDLNGSVLLAGTFSNDQEALDLSSFGSGIYFLKTDLGTTKLVKN